LLDALPIIYACVRFSYTLNEYLNDVTRNCMLYILNVRRSLRDAELASTGLSDSRDIHPGGTRNQGLGRPAVPVELSSLGGTQMQTQSETEGSKFVSLGNS
jgi:hypothetical protein